MGLSCLLESRMGHKETWNTFINTSTASMNDVAYGCVTYPCSAGNKGCQSGSGSFPGSGSAVYPTISVLKSQSQGHLSSAFLPPHWVDSTPQKAVNVMIYQTTAHKMSWAHFRFTAMFYVKKNSSVAFALEEMLNYRIVLTLKDLWAWTKKFNKPYSLYLGESFCCKRKGETKAEQSKFCTGWCNVQQSEKQRWKDLSINVSIQQSWKLALALVILFLYQVSPESNQKTS